jgi:hypothetical protein
MSASYCRPGRSRPGFRQCKVCIRLASAHVWQIKQALERARWFTLAGGVLVIAGSVLFFTAASGPT